MNNQSNLNYNKEIYSCNICGKSSKPHSECYKTYCPFCSVKFNKLKNFIEHCQVYHQEKFCSQCNYVFSSLENHKKNYHKN